jgi:L-aminopeptidase/D-esterase-like protein
MITAMPDQPARPVARFPGALTDIAGLAVGHHTEARRPTGCTVVLCPAGAVCGVDVRGAAPGTRETDLLRPDALVPHVNAVLLAGGSAFGLDAAGGVMRWLEARGHGFAVGPAVVPIVPAAVLFDLWLGDATVRPDAAAGAAACDAAWAATVAIGPGASGGAGGRAGMPRAPAEGCVGAGAGASLGKLFGVAHAMKGGIGTASITVGAVTVAALVAVNALGDVLDPATGRLLAGARRADGRGLRDAAACLAAGELPAAALAGMATTIGVVATDAALTKVQCQRLAGSAHDGLARCIMPVHTMSDGDTMFALATGGSGRPGDMTVLGQLAAEATVRAVLNAVRAATAWGPLPAWQDLQGPAP